MIKRNRNLIWCCIGFVILFPNLLFSQVKSSESVNIFKFILNEYPPPTLFSNIFNYKGASLSINDSVLVIKKGKMNLCVNNSLIRDYTFVINGKRIDSVLPGNENYFGINLNKLPLDLANICIISNSKIDFFLIPISLEGCLGNSCNYFMFFVIPYSKKGKSYQAFYFESNFSIAYQFTIIDKDLYYIDIENSINDPLLLDKLDDSEKKEVDNKYFFFNKIKFDAKINSWDNMGVSNVFKTKLIDSLGNINYSSFINISDKLIKHYSVSGRSPQK